MIVRLFLALLLALGTAPVAAMPVGCHDMAMAPSATAAMAMPTADARHDHHQPAVAGHGCVGCAALADWLAERVPAPLPAAAAPPRSPAMRFVLNAAGPPRLRPPRMG